MAVETLYELEQRPIPSLERQSNRKSKLLSDGYTTSSSSKDTRANDYSLDYTLSNFEAGKKASTPLTERYSETSQGLTHLISERNYHREAADTLHYYTSDDLKALDSRKCPGYCIDPAGVGEPGCVIEVTSDDPLNVAKRLIRMRKLPDGSLDEYDRVLVLNMYHVGEDLGRYYLSGGQGSQEELCYRTSFSLTLPEDDLQTDDDTGVAYSSHVVIVRDSHGNGHAWYDLSQPNLLDAVSIASLSALPKPVLSHGRSETDFANISDREDMMKRWRNLLRLAGARMHVRLVLGLPGCEHQKPAPIEAVASCFMQVLREQEFRGGWFEKIIFAVPHRASNNNKANKSLHGKVFG